MKKIIYSDLDGTLLSGHLSDNYISDLNIKAINKWIKSGNYFGIATGRNINGILRHFKDTNVLINMPFVLANSNLVYDLRNNEIIYKNVLEKAVILEAISLYKTHRKYLRLVITNPYDEYIFVDKDSFDTKNIHFFTKTITFDEN